MVNTYNYSDAVQITEHFNSSEFRCKDGSNHSYKVDNTLVTNLEKFFRVIPELFGVGVSKIVVTSGYRCSAHDRSVGGYGSGPHVDGKAADICVFDDNLIPVSSKLVCCAAQEIGFLGIANITKDYIYTHVDMKDRKNARGMSYKWYGNEVHGNGTVTDDFWTYFGVTRKTNKSEPEVVKLRGIDVSVWQGDIDFAKAASEIDFAILRAGYGKMESQVDAKFEQNYSGFKAQKTPVGAYWYSYADSVEAAREEAYACLTHLKGKQFELPIFYDILEDDHIPMLQRKGNVARLINEIIPAFCDILEKAGYFVGLYVNTAGYNNYLNDSNKQRYVQWVADWTGSCGYTGEKVLWQYSCKGTVPGIDGEVDKDYAYTDFAIIKEGGFNGWNASDYVADPDHPEVQPENPAIIPDKEDPTPEEAMNIFEKILQEIKNINSKL